MSNNPSERPIRLLHIPKTAGTTLASSLLRSCGRKDRFVFSADSLANPGVYATLPEEHKKSIRIFIGHSLFETGIPAADEARIITIVREPVSRVKSFIRHVAAGKTGHRAATATEPFNVDEFLEKGGSELSNLQVKILTNRHGIDWDTRLRELGDDGTLALAKERLYEKVHAFGIQERFDECWVALWRSLDRTSPVYAMMNRRKEKERIQFTTAQEQKIREMNGLDLALYADAVKVFEQRLSEGMVPAAELANFRHRQKLYGAALTVCWNAARKAYRTYTRTRKKALARFSRR